MMEKKGQIEDITNSNNHFFVTFTKRKDAESTIKAYFGNLIIEGKNLTIVWAKKASNKTNTSTKDATGAPTPSAKIDLPEFSLVPAFNTKLKPVRAPKPPS